MLLLSLMFSATALPELVGLDGRRHNLMEEANGKPVAVIFICHDCPICNTYAPEFGRLSASYGKRVAIDLVYTEEGLSLPDARSHAKAYNLGRANLFLDSTGKFAAACKAKVTPEAAVFDNHGHQTYLGRIDDLFYDFGKQRSSPSHHDLREAIDATLAHKPVQPATGSPVGCSIDIDPLP